MKITTLEEAKAAAYRGAYRGLRHQGWRSAGSGAASLFRTPDGLKCAVGWLIPDKNIRPDASRLALNGGVEMAFAFGLAEPLQNWYDSASKSDRLAFEDHLEQLMNSHDAPGAPFERRDRFNRIGRSEGYPVPSILPQEHRWSEAELEAE